MTTQDNSWSWRRRYLAQVGHYPKGDIPKHVAASRLFNDKINKVRTGANKK